MAAMPMAKVVAPKAKNMRLRIPKITVPTRPRSSSAARPLLIPWRTSLVWTWPSTS